MSAEQEVPTVVVVMDGGCIHAIHSNVKVRVVVADYDLEGLDGPFTNIYGDEIYTSESHIEQYEGFARDLVAAHDAQQQGECHE